MDFSLLHSILIMLDMKFQYLLIPLLLLIFLSVAIPGKYQESDLNMLLTSFVLISAMYTIHGRGSKMWWTVGIFSVTIILNILSFFIINPILLVTSLLSKVVFFGWEVLGIWHAISKKKFSLEQRILGSVCIYLLIGLVWARLYGVVEILRPESFLTLQGNTVASLDSFIYYSYVTLTTLGYGDILPITPIAKMLAAMEAVFGVLYLSIWMALLVSIYSAKSSWFSHDD